MKKLFVLAAAAGLLMGVASCAKDGNDAVNGGGQGDGKALMSLSFTLPQGDFTRAVEGDQPGNAMESTINSIQVWIFQDGQAVSGIEGTVGDPGANGGGFFDLPIASFDDSAAPVYTLEEAETLLTASGDVTIYVAANTPTAYAIPYATPAALLAKIGTVAELTANTGTGATALTMFSDAKNETLLVSDEDLTTVENTVEVNLNRVVSKVQATWKSTDGIVATTPADFQSTWTAGPTLTYAVTGFNVHQDARQSYLVKKADGTTLSGDIDLTVKPSTLTVHPDAVKGTTLGNYTGGFYLAENKSSLLDESAGLSLKGNTTFAMIGTKVSLDKIATWNTITEQVEWVNHTANATPAEDDIVVIKATKGGVDYILLTIDNSADAVNNSTTLVSALGANGYTNVTTTVFWDSYVHFRKWLNKDGSNDYNIDRNQFIHINITGIAKLDGLFPGFPGVDDTTPETPVDPVDEDEDEDEEPVDPLPAELIVEVTVNQWVYRANDTILQ